jgi:hypothetical protein
VSFAVTISVVVLTLAIAEVGIPHEAKNIPWKTMLNSLYLRKVQVVNWPAGVSPVGPDFIFKDLKTNELKALVGPYLKRCMGTDYNAELARVEHQELKKKKKGGLKVPDEELAFVPWSDGKNKPACIMELVTQISTESKELSMNEDPDMLNIPLITDTEGGVLRTLMDCILFMKNLPASIDQVSQPLPHTVPTRKIPPRTRQPISQQGQALHPQHQENWTLLL